MADPAKRRATYEVPIHARFGVPHVWLVDPLAQILEVCRLEGPRYSVLATWRGDAVVRADPFDAIELELCALWAR
jgi:Uma2 family endonuclease